MKTELKHKYPILPFSPHSTSLLTPLPLPCPEQRRVIGNGGCNQFIILDVCNSFPQNLIPCSIVGSTPWNTFFKNILPICVFPMSSRTAPACVHIMGCSPAGKNSSSMGPSWAAACTRSPAALWAFHRLQVWPGFYSYRCSSRAQNFSRLDAPASP